MAGESSITSEPMLANAVLRGLSQGWLPGLAWLDGSGQGRSFVGAEPDLVIEGDDMAQLDAVDVRWRADPSRVWVGWLTYELGIDFMLSRRAGRGPRPGLCLRRYPAVLERHADGHELVHGDPDAARQLAGVLERAASAPMGEPPWPLEPLRPRLVPEEYRERVGRAQQAIAAGRASHVHLSQQLGARWKASAPPGTPVRVASAYASLRRRRPVTMGALLEADADTWFLSNSAETLLGVRHGQGLEGADLVRVWPTEGVRPRDPDPARDAAIGDALLHDPRERARHQSIVDQACEDLGRIAVPGTLYAEPQPQRRVLPLSHQLITQVSASLPRGLSLRALVEAMFPAAGVIGSPRQGAAQVIDELEEHARGIHGGAIVVLEPNGLSMSIPVRTASVDRYGATLCVGGSIGGEGDPEAERLRTLAEAQAFAD
ncbi:chorismate-binding protein [Paraliomyxa miuraensis]|uniref:chorismate-binding protein n=1 Tax=Paraliomyxa miuraensis TaxID=376150 RepID=UPI002254E18B|nr:chorismate-binding protein [Paraliomyxa miuraensis]MCX4245466.1 chorismate-binding protein [Paraliomyxa miuraensis]